MTTRISRTKELLGDTEPLDSRISSIEELLNELPSKTQTKVCALSAALNKAHERDNGDVSLSNRLISLIFERVNQIGFVRQLLGIPANSIEIHANRHNTVPFGSPFLGALSSGGEAFCGLGNTYAAITETLPGNWKKLVKAYNADELLNDVEKTEHLSHRELSRAKEEISSEFKIATAQFINQFFYLWLGISQLMHGTLTFIWGLYETVQNFFQLIHSTAVCAWHLLPGLTSPLLHLISKVSGVAAGVFYLIRGICIISRSSKSKVIVDDFQKKFERAGQMGETPQQKVANLMLFMRNQEDFADQLEKVQDKGSVENLGLDYLKRRFSTEFLTQIEEGTIYTAYGKLDENDTLTSYDSNTQVYNLKDRVEYLKAIDKGIYTEQLKHKLGKVIGIAMIIGAVLTIIAACVFTGGLAPLIVGLVACIIFALMEYVFYVYDNSEAFEKYRDSHYKVSTWLQPLIAAAFKEESDLISRGEPRVRDLTENEGILLSKEELASEEAS